MITSFFAPKNKRACPTDDDSSTNKRPSSAVSSSTASTASSDASSDVSSLLSHFPSSDESISWRTALKKQLESKKFESLATFVAKERAIKTVYPPPEMIFSALAKTPLHKVKVVIVGQDPYHQPSQGHGLSFSVPHNIAIPPSLRNIYKELLNDTEVGEFNMKPSHGNLERWANQGVLLLNNVLTVRRGEAGSHSKRGWEEFTDAVIRAVVERDDDITTKDTDDHNNADHADNKEKRGRGVVFLLWGKPASVKAQTVLSKYARKNSKHAIITCSHPSPLGATKTSSPFIGSKCFSRANKELANRGWDVVDWRVDGEI